MNDKKNWSNEYIARCLSMSHLFECYPKHAFFSLLLFFLVERMSKSIPIGSPDKRLWLPKTHSRVAHTQYIKHSWHSTFQSLLLHLYNNIYTHSESVAELTVRLLRQLNYVKLQSIKQSNRHNKSTSVVSVVR